MNTEHVNDNSPDIRFNEILVSDHRCNINRNLEDMDLLIDFSDISPKYDKENGLHLQISVKNSPKKKIIYLSHDIFNDMLIKNSKNMTDDEYFLTFVDKKKEFVENCLIMNTFSRGFEIPSAVQSLVIIEMIKKRDAVIQFKSGTGKTHAFLLGCLWHFDLEDEMLQHVFITNSHEVATQIYDQVKKLLPPETKIVLAIGHKKESFASTGGFKTPIGTSNLNRRHKSLKDEKKEIQEAQIIVGTMGKFYDFFSNREWINAKYLKTICVDEFDNIVVSPNKSSHSQTVMSTEEQIANVIKKIPIKTQRVFFSATVSEYALQIAHSYFRPYKSETEPLIVILNQDDYTLEGIRQYYVPCDSFPIKKDVLIDLLKQCRITQCIIFTNTMRTAQELKTLLDSQKIAISSAVFHGGLSETDRSSIYKDFVENKTRLLISTDLTSRGLDVQSINAVINFDMPDSLDTYIHRVGRSGRYGKKGVAISLLIISDHNNEMKKVEEINKHSLKSRMEELPGRLDTLL